MKKETRIVEIEREVYIADDGKEFDYCDDCIAYEMRLTAKRLKLYDIYFKRADGVDICWYAILDTEDDLARFKELCAYEGVTRKGLEHTGTYMYTDRGDYWSNISEALKRLGGTNK